MPANIVVTVAGEDSHPGDGNVSLREALAIANTDNQPDTITFAPGITDVLITDSAALHISEAGAADRTVIDGGGRVVLRRDGSTTSAAVLSIDQGVFAELRGLTITGGNSTAVRGGGGLFIDKAADVTLDHVTVRGNRATGFFGGGGISTSGRIRLFDSTVFGNTTTGDGGGISNTGDLLLLNSTVAGNTAGGLGGGVSSIAANENVPPTSLTAVNSTVSDNVVDGNPQALRLGGGIYTSAPATLTNVTVTNNRAGTSAGGVYVSGNGAIKLDNTIVSGNFGQAGAADDLFVAGTMDPAGGHNLIGGDALLGPLADNGGPTLTHALLPGSPAVDAGDDSLAVGPDGTPLATDQRGFVRVSGAAVDVGAYELRQVTAADSADLVAAGGVPGGLPMVNVYDDQGRAVASFLAYGRQFRGGVSVALGDVNGDGVVDVITGAGPGGGPHVKVFDGTKLWMTQAVGQLAPAAELASFFAFGAGFAGGVHVAAGDLNGDGKADLIAGAGAGGGPHVKVFDGADRAVVASFFAYAPTFSGGVDVAAGDVTGDGVADVVTGAGPGGGPHVKVFAGAALAAGGSAAAQAEADPVKSFFAFAPTFAGGVSVAVGAVTPAGHADIITGAGPGGGPHVKAFDATSLAQEASFFAFDPTFAGGVSVATARYNGGPTADIVTGAGPGGAPMVKVFGGTGPSEVASFTAFDPAVLSGVFVG